MGVTTKTAQPCGCIEPIFQGKKARTECEHGNTFLSKGLARVGSSADGVVSGCVECHPEYEAKRIDLLPLLLAHDFRSEFVHAIVVHQAPPFHPLEIVTGTAWQPVEHREERERSAA
jgi:hypothetical protein